MVYGILSGAIFVSIWLILSNQGGTSISAIIRIVYYTILFISLGGLIGLIIRGA